MLAAISTEGEGEDVDQDMFAEWHYWLLAVIHGAFLSRGWWSLDASQKGGGKGGGGGAVGASKILRLALVAFNSSVISTFPVNTHSISVVRGQRRKKKE